MVDDLFAADVLDGGAYALFVAHQIMDFGVATDDLELLCFLYGLLGVGGGVEEVLDPLKLIDAGAGLLGAWVLCAAQPEDFDGETFFVDATEGELASVLVEGDVAVATGPL